MSSLKDFIQAPSNNFPGNMALSIGAPASGWLEADGSIVSQATYPTLFSQVGLIQDGFNTWTRRTPGTISTIRALTYSATDGLYVYAGDGGTLGTSTDAITWTVRTPGTVTFILLSLILQQTVCMFMQVLEEFRHIHRCNNLDPTNPRYCFLDSCSHLR
jgi:hypothetical protein